MSAPTPGQWAHQESSSDTCAFEVVQPFVNGNVIAGEYGIEKEADARLIAAAPEMLEALLAMRTVMDMGAEPSKLDSALTWRECDEKARSMCDIAIAKATGGAA